MLSLGVLVLKVQLPGCTSLKEKRSRLKPLLARLHREFNISAAEIESLEIWQSAGIACALVSNDPNQTRRALQQAARWVEENWPDVELIEEQIELR
jgi:uncharacterized protein YlxP (DUF503 family)